MTNKYGAKKTTVDGITFDSIKESLRYQELMLLERAGEIENLTLQPLFELVPRFTMADGTTVRAMTYTADFMYKDGDYIIVEDVKSKATSRNRAFQVSWKLLQYKVRTSTHIKLRIHI